MKSGDKSLRSILVQLLISLKSFYTFKELEQLLGVSQHNLWKYISLNMVPEEHTAKKIYSRIVEEGIVENVIRRQIALAGRNGKWVYLWNPPLTDLIGFLVYSYFSKELIDSVLCFPEESLPLGISIARWYRRKLCTACTYPIYRSTSYISSTYIDPGGAPKPVFVPRNCLPRNSKVLLIADELDNIDLFIAIYSILRKAQVKPMGLILVNCSRENVEHIREKYRLKVLVIGDAISSNKEV